jgi:hypothetical protein
MGRRFRSAQTMSRGTIRRATIAISWQLWPSLEDCGAGVRQRRPSGCSSAARDAAKCKAESFWCRNPYGRFGDWRLRNGADFYCADTHSRRKNLVAIGCTTEVVSATYFKAGEPSRPRLEVLKGRIMVSQNHAIKSTIALPKLGAGTKNTTFSTGKQIRLVDLKSDKSFSRRRSVGLSQSVVLQDRCDRTPRFASARFLALRAAQERLFSR